MAPIVEKIQNQTAKKIVLAGSGSAASYIGYKGALNFIEEAQKDSWLSYVPVPKKAIGVGSAVTATWLASLVAAPENKKYVWLGGAVSLLFSLSKNFLPGGGNGIGSGGDGGSHSQGANTGKDNGNQTSVNDGLMMQELKSSGFIDGIMKNNGYLKLSVGESLIYARVGGAFQGNDGNDTVEIYPNEILFLISNVPELKVVEIFRLIGDQEVITNKINPIVDHVHAENKTVVVHDRPFSVWGSVGS